MKHTVKYFPVVFLLLTHNVHDCNSEPIPFVTLSSISSLKNIGQFLWNTRENTPEVIYMRKRLLSSTESVRDSYSHDIKSNLRTRFSEHRDRVKAEKNYIEVNKLISRIEHFYEDVVRYNESIVSHSHNGTYQKIKSEVRKNLSNNFYRPMGLVRLIRELVLAKDEYSILKNLQHRFQGYTDTCSDGDDVKSAQKYILDYLMLIVAAQVKTFMTIKMSSEIIKNVTKDAEDYSSDVELMNKELVEKYTSIINTYGNLVRGAPREIWRCDPSSHVEDVTYTKLKNVFKRFVTSEADLAYNDACTNECGTLNPRSWNPCLDSALGVHCPGPLWNCGSGFDLDLFTTVNFCYSDPNNTRVYDSLTLDSENPSSNNHNTIYGSENACDGNRKGSAKLTYEYTGIFEISKCDVCTCFSDQSQEYNKEDPQRSERFFYSGAVHADVANNYVLTGVRLVKKDGIIFFEIQQGKLSNFTSIESSSVSWKTIEPESLHNPSNLIKIHWNQRSIELQDIDVPHGHFLVGLRMGVIRGRIVLKVLSLPFNFSDDNTEAYSVDDIMTNISPGRPKTSLDLKDCHSPDPTVKSNMAVTDKYLMFSTSSMYQDVGQTTLPFLDIQNVTTTVPTLMVGAGFYFKYTDKCVGYLGIKLKTYNLSPFCDINEENLQEYPTLAQCEW